MSDFVIDIEKHLSRLGRDIQDLVERVVPLEDKGHDFTPACDIVESEEQVRILLDLPGMSKEEIHVGLKEHVLTVKGERTDDLSEAESYKRQERKTGLFSRSFALPQNVNAAETDARFKDGVLIISMPKSDVLDDSKSIPVN
ncbi:MAG: Hsp20/alpha crystallin family protein [Balneolaceae bacterium]|nr:Hsp20/alpha crystallin family protein [Balneolaceae bacterium]